MSSTAACWGKRSSKSLNALFFAEGEKERIRDKRSFFCTYKTRKTFLIYSATKSRLLFPILPGSGALVTV